MRSILFACSLVFIVSVSLSQRTDYLAVIPPFLPVKSDSGIPSSIQLKNQRYVLFQYQNAVVVYAEGIFTNSAEETVRVNLGLPSTGYRMSDPDDKVKISNGLLGVRLWIENERIEPEIHEIDGVQWFTVAPLLPHDKETMVKAMFWMQTSLSNIDSLPGMDTIPIPKGQRSFLVDLADASVWRETIEEAAIILVLKDGLSPRDAGFSAKPDNHDLGISKLSWTLRDLEPTTTDNVRVRYSTRKANSFGTMARAAEVIQDRIYDELREYLQVKKEE